MAAVEPARYLPAAGDRSRRPEPHPPARRQPDRLYLPRRDPVQPGQAARRGPGGTAGGPAQPAGIKLQRGGRRPRGRAGPAAGRPASRYAARSAAGPAGGHLGAAGRGIRPGPGRTAMTPFEILGLAADSQLTDDDVRAAWRRIAAATHPDRADGGDSEAFAAAAAAYT